MTRPRNRSPREWAHAVGFSSESEADRTSADHQPSEVRTYQLPPEELERYRGIPMPPPAEQARGRQMQRVDSWRQDKTSEEDEEMPRGIPLTDAQVAEILRLRERGRTILQTALEMNLSNTAIDRVIAATKSAAKSTPQTTPAATEAPVAANNRGTSSEKVDRPSTEVTESVDDSRGVNRDESERTSPAQPETSQPADAQADNAATAAIQPEVSGETRNRAEVRVQMTRRDALDIYAAAITVRVMLDDSAAGADFQNAGERRPVMVLADLALQVAEGVLLR
ncbi:MAG: hypothetical protein KGL39_17405 [Patescibacteria group bacterium]|nr:hypothetical protein [Patescibacteria group bacterium]